MQHCNALITKVFFGAKSMLLPIGNNIGAGEAGVGRQINIKLLYLNKKIVVDQLSLKLGCGGIQDRIAIAMS